MKRFNFLTAILISSIAITTSCKKETITPENPPTAVVIIPIQPAYQPGVRLGFTNNFAILASTAVTTTGASVVYGDLGISDGSLLLGFPKGSIHGLVEINSPLSLTAQTDLAIAYENLQRRATDDMVTLSGNTGGLTLTPGLYTANSFEILSGNLVIDALGDEHAIFVIKVANNLRTLTNTKIILKNNAQASNIFWQVAGSVSLGEASAFKGNVFSNQSIVVANGATVEGRLLTMNGSIELNSNTITKP